MQEFLALIFGAFLFGVSQGSEAIYGNPEGCAVAFGADEITDGWVYVTSTRTFGHEEQCIINARTGDSVDLSCFGEGMEWPWTTTLTFSPDNNVLTFGLMVLHRCE